MVDITTVARQMRRREGRQTEMGRKTGRETQNVDLETMEQKQIETWTRRKRDTDMKRGTE